MFDVWHSPATMVARRTPRRDAGGAGLDAHAALLAARGFFFFETGGAQTPRRATRLLYKRLGSLAAVLDFRHSTQGGTVGGS